jgi:uncharacterized protein YegL
MRSPASAVCLLLAAAALLPARAAGAEDDRKKNAAAEKAFLEDYTAAASDEKARAKAVETLGAAPDAVKVSMLLDRVLPKDVAPAVQSAAVSVLRKVRDEAAVKALADEAMAKGSWNVRGPVLEAMGAFASPVAVEALRKILRTEETRALAAALFALSENHPPEALDDVRKLTGHLAWQVRLGTLEYLERLRDKGTLGLLVDRLEAESGRLRFEVVGTLKAITGKNYGTDANKWRAYVGGGEKAADEVGKPPPGPGAAGGRAVATGAVEKVEPTYYGMKVYSDKVVFVIDMSLSMNEEMVIDRETLVRETGAVVSSGHGEAGEKKPEGPKLDDEIAPIEWWKIKTRMDFARSQLRYVISTLQHDQCFDVVWFSDSVKAWQGHMIPASRAAKLKAADWLDALECEGGTDTWAGLSKALNLVGRGTEDENYSRGADTIYFMSDGEPSKGDIKDKDQIVAAIERISKVRHVKVHVVQIGTSPLAFMKRLAAVTGGDYKFFNAKGTAR